MTHSGYDDPPQGLATGYSDGRDGMPAPTLFGPSAFYAAGGLYSTAEDLVRWNEGLYNGQVLSEAQLQKMLTAHAPMPDNMGSGYGIVVGESFGTQWAGSGGGLDGYQAVITRYLDDRVTIVVIGNQDMDSFAISYAVEKRFFGAD
jgi:CubicO group peptidase (beta-lactamase class C family)